MVSCFEEPEERVNIVGPPFGRVRREIDVTAVGLDPRSSFANPGLQFSKLARTVFTLQKSTTSTRQDTHPFVSQGDPRVEERCNSLTVDRVETRRDSYGIYPGGQ